MGWVKVLHYQLTTLPCPPSPMATGSPTRPSPAGPILPQGWEAVRGRGRWEEEMDLPAGKHTGE